MKLKFLILILSTLSIFAQGNQKAVITFDTVADMVARGNPRNPAANVVEVLGYHSRYDGNGGGRFVGTNTVTSTNLGTRIKSQLAGWSWERVRDDKVDVRWFGATDGSGDDYAAVTNAIANLSGAKTLDLGKDIHLSAGVTITNSNLKIVGGSVTASQLISGGMFTLYGTNVDVSGLRIDGDNLAFRGLIAMPGCRAIFDTCTLIDFIQSAGETAVPAAIRVAGETDVIVRNSYINGVNAAQNGNAVGVFVSVIGTEGPPIRFEMTGSFITNVIPSTDGDAFRLQNSWTVNCNVRVEGNTLAGAKRGAKIMSPGALVARNYIPSTAYAGVSVYSPDVQVIQNVITNFYGDMGVEVGSAVMSQTNVVIERNFIYRDRSATVVGTGDGIRLIGTNIVGSSIVGNLIDYARNGIYVTGAAIETLISRNRISGTASSAVRFAKTTLSSVDYFPSVAMIEFNVLSGITGTPIVIEDSSNIVVTHNYENGTGPLLLQATSTNVLQWLNRSQSELGWNVTQFGMDASGYPVITNGAIVTNFQAFSIGIDSPASASHPLRLRKTQDGLYQIYVENLSAGASASAGISLVNDLGEGVSMIHTGSGHANTNETFLTSSPNSRGFRFNASGAGQRQLFQVNSAAKLTIDSTGSTFTGTNVFSGAAQFDANATAGETRFMIYDVDNGTLERVSVGIADSGGLGFKLLRIAN